MNRRSFIKAISAATVAATIPMGLITTDALKSLPRDVSFRMLPSRHPYDLEPAMGIMASVNGNTNMVIHIRKADLEQMASSQGTPNQIQKYLLECEYEDGDVELSDHNIRMIHLFSKDFVKNNYDISKYI